METEDKHDETGVFSTCVSEEDLDEARRKLSFQQLFGLRVNFLSAAEREAERTDLQTGFILQSRAAQLLSEGHEAVRTSHFDRAVICFCKAVILQPQQTQLFVAQAESYLQLCDFQSAAVCYKQAELLQPGVFRSRLVSIYYLQGQCLFDRRLFTEALEAFARAAALEPGGRRHQVRSLACLAATGRHGDCLQLVNDWLSSDAPTSDLYVLRARLHQQLHQTSQCHSDVRSALALKGACPQAAALLQQLRRAGERARQQAEQRALAGRLREALCFIDLAAENCPRDARLHLFRGILHRRLRDFTAAVEDLVRAVELSEEGGGGGRAEGSGRGSVEAEAELQLVLTYNDFAAQCFSRGLFAEAALLLNKAVEEEKKQAGLYLNRGDCFFKQGEWCYALSDYQQAEEMMWPGDPALRLRLALLHNKLGSLHFASLTAAQGIDL